jgi:hypothetical protein
MNKQNHCLLSVEFHKNILKLKHLTWRLFLYILYLINKLLFGGHSENRFSHLKKPLAGQNQDRHRIAEIA